jgi:serine/threonine-protein kinase RsbW
MREHESTDFDASLESLSGIRQTVSQWCEQAGASEEERQALVVAIDEACTNIIEHGYADRTAGLISLAFERADGELRFHISDNGRSFNPDRAPVPDLEADWRERPVGGLGWHLIRNMVDDVSYRSDSTGNVLTLIKKQAPATETGAK